MKLSILTPAFNEDANLDALYARVVEAMAQLGVDWEWLIVDDHSRDATFEVVRRLAHVDPRVRGVRLARNAGSHVAITCGLHHVTGDAAAMMAADLQDPPETLRAMLDVWRAGARVVWAVRRTRPGDRSHAGFAAVYYWVMRHVVGMKDIPSRGADFFLIDRAVIEAFRRLREPHVNVFALIAWLGFRQDYIEYDKQPRAAGRSGWTLARKIKLVVDSIVAFSDAPIRACTYVGVGFGVVALGAFLAGLALWPGPGPAVILVSAVLLGCTGVVLLAIGALGEYLWRTLDQARARPLFLIEAVTGESAAAPMTSPLASR